MKIIQSVYIFILTFFLVHTIAHESFGQADANLVKVGSEMYNVGDVKDALEIFKQALTINPKNSKANFMIGKCYIESIHKDKSLAYFLTAYSLDRAVSDNILYCIAHAYQFSYKFNEAISYYKEYINTVPTTNLTDGKKIDEIEKTEHRLEECKVAIEFVKSPDDIKIENLGLTVNSIDEDYAPVITSDESMLFFTSRRQGSTGNKKDNDDEFFEDIYMSKGSKGNWQTPENLGKPVNSDLHDACIGISPNGKQLFIYKDNDKYKGDIFFCKLDNKGMWSNPSPLKGKINTDFIEKAISISADGKKIFFSSNRPGGKGGMDIYMSTIGKKGVWEDPINLGDPINTAFDDDCPFLTSDANTLYFSSKGHSGMGGFDVYKSAYDKNKKQWAEPENLKYPINSPDDDMYFVLAENSKYGYYASINKDEVGDVDIYRIQMPERIIKGEDSSTHKKTVKVQEKKIAAMPVTLNIKVVDKDGKTIPAKIEISQAESGKSLVSKKTKDGIFKYNFINKTESEYVVIAEKEGYVFKSHKVKIPAAAADAVNMEEVLELEEVSVGIKRILKNIYFEYNQAIITSNSFVELKKLLNLLKENPKVSIEIDGHTDNVGTRTYNKQLSQHRSQAVINWLIEKGIASNRLKAKGFGEEVPIASNDDEQEGRELNRRTEFVITSK